MLKPKKSYRTAMGALCAVAGSSLAVPAFAQQAVPDAPPVDLSDNAFSGDFVTVGAGVVLGPSYTGSDDYVVSPVPLIQGSYGGVDLNIRAAGLALDFIPDGEKIGFDLGVAGRLRSDRNNQISDDVVASLGKLDRAIEVGPTAGVSVNQLLNPFDSLSISTDVLWDINGAHGGMTIAPAISYFTPLSRAVAASLSLSTQYADSDFYDYYFRVTPAQSVATAGELPAFEPDGGGFVSAGANLLVAFDLDGDIANGGWGLVTVASYSRVLGDAKRTPYTSVRGSADQFTAVVGVAYTF